MSYNITSTNTGVVLNTATTQNPATAGTGVYVTNTTASHGGTAIYGNYAAAWTLTNYGTITATATLGAGVLFTNGGTVSNDAATASISGYLAGVDILGAAGSVSNLGTVKGTGTGGVGVGLQGGNVTNATGALISGGLDGVYIHGGTGTASNLGRIQGSNVGVRLIAGGYATNGSSGTISGSYGVGIQGGAGTVSNTGTISGTGAAGIKLFAGGYFTNAAATALISGYVDGVFIGGGSGTVTNSGTIASTGTASTGVYLGSGGYVGNGAGGTISGGADGVRVSTSAGTVNNFGTIGAAGSNGVYLTGGGLVINNPGRIGGLGPPVPPGLISGYDGLRIAGAAGTGTLLNDGNIVSTGTGFGAQAVDFLAGGTLYNYGAVLGTNTDASGVNAGFADDTIINGSTSNGSATIAGWLNGIDQFSSSGIVINFGTITATGTASPTGIYMGAGGSIDNLGVVGATGGANGIGVNFANGGTLQSEIGAYITGSSDGVVISGTYGSVRNFGSIGGGVDGVVLKATGASFVNYGRVVGYGSYGLYLYAGGGATNAATNGVIQGYNDGIRSTHAAASVVNVGTIVGTGASANGVLFSVAGSTLRNSGTVSAGGGDAAHFTGSNNRLIVDPGAVFLGTRAAYGGGGGNDVLELAAGTTGTLGGGRYAGFDVTQIDAGAGWAVAGVYSIPAGGTLLDFGTLTNLGTLLGSGAQLIVDPGTFVNSGYVNTTVTLDGGSYLDNTSTGTISVAGVAVLGTTSPNYVFNAGTIIGSGASGVGVELFNAGTAGNTGTIGGYLDGVVIRGGYGSISNLGTVSATTTFGAGAYLAAGGSITNGSALATGALIIGNDNALSIFNAAGSVTNFGTLAAVGSAGYGAVLSDGGTITNSGTILETGTDGTAVRLGNGGILTNNSGALIAGGGGGVEVLGAAGTVSNSGTIAGTGSTSGVGVRLLAGGSVSNAATGLISGADRGVDVIGAAGSVSNQGTIDGLVATTPTTGFAIGLEAGGVVVNGVSGSGAGLLQGGPAGVVVNGAAGTITNYGTIATTDTFTGAAIVLHAGGSVSNAATGFVSGFNDGVLVSGAAGTIGNSGTILALGSVTNANGSIVSGNAVDLVAGGVVTNSTVGLIEGYHIGILTGTASSPTNVVNFGTIESLQTAANGYIGSAVQLDRGGSVANYGLIASPERGVGAGQVSTLFNTGTILTTGSPAVSGTITLYPSAVVFQAGGLVVNGQSGSSAGLIEAGWNGVQIRGSAGTVVNFGTIESTAGVRGPLGFPSTGVLLQNVGGSVINGAPGSTGALIHAELGIYAGGSGGVPVAGAVATVVNWGTIETSGPLGTASSGVRLGAGGAVTNHGIIESVYSNGVSIGNPTFASTGTVVNFGTIAHTGVGTSGEAVYLGGGGTVTNYGLISGARSGTSSANGYPGAVDAQNVAATVVNLGTITNPNYSNGINLIFGGTLINGSTADSTATIFGPHAGVAIGVTLNSVPTGGVGLVFNYGTIQNAGSNANALGLASGGTVTNRGVISSGRNGVAFGNTSGAPGPLGTVVNYGTIVSTAPTAATAGAGIELFGGGLVVNKAGASVIALRAAILDNGTTSTAATISNAGTLTGSVGIQINPSDTGNNTIANFGVISGSGGTAISLGGGADLVILEPGSVLSGAIANFAPGDTLDLPTVPFSPGDTVAFDGTTLTVSGGGESQSVALAGIAAETDFILESDAQGGAELGPVASGSNLVVSSGQVLTVLAGQSVSNVTVESGGVFDVASGGVASAAVIQSGGLENVFSGGTDSGATVSSGGFEDVFGNAVATLVLNGGSQTVEAGGTASAVVLDGTGLQTVSGFAGGTVVGSGDEELVTSGGVASGTVISEGGSEVVLSGGLTSDTTIAGGTLELQSGALASGLVDFAGSGGVLQLDSLTGPAAAVAGLLTGDTLDFRALPFAGSDTVTFDGTTLTVSGGGVSESVSLSGLAASTVFLLRSDGSGGSDLGLVPASGAVVSAGEVLHISAGETLSGVTVLSGGVLEVDSGGTALGTMVSSGGEELVLSGGTDSGAVISSGGFEDVFGSASASLVLNGGSQTVEAGGSVTGAVLDGVGLQTVSGVAIGTVVSAGDEQLVASGGVASGTTVLSGGLLVVAAGGVASGAVIASGGDEVVSSGGVDRGAVVSGGGVEEVFGNGRGTVVLSGGEQLVEPGGNASGTVISQGGREEVLGGVTSDTRIAGGELEVTTGAAAAGVIDFGGVVGTLRLESLATPGATLEGVAAGDVIDLPLLSFATSDTATLGQNELLTVSGGGQSVSLQFDASVAGKGFALSDDGSGGTLVTLTAQVPQASLFDFVFIYNGGQDYYLGRVADDGRFGVAVGETKTNAAGSYIIFGEESGASSAAAGSVFVDYYSHGGPGASSGVPVKTAAGSADGNAGLGSESDTLVGLDGAGHAFSSTQPAAFATTALFGFVFTYADGAAYSGTVADNTPGGLPGSRTVTDASGNVLGVYTIFRDGVTSRPAGSVVIDRFVANGIAVLANHASNTAVDGRNGLGSEVGSVTVGSVDHAFGPRAEPVVTGNAPTEPASSTPPLSDVIANEVDRIFADILGRFPTQGEFDTAGGELGQGTSPGDLRAALAGGSEASGDVAGLYRQVFGRAATTGEIAGATGALANGGSLAGLQQQLANSAEASGDINQVYRDILGRDADPSGLASFVAALGDETPGHLTDPGGLAGLAGVRDVLAHSGQAEDALTSLFQTIIGRAPSTAERAGMEDRLVAAGTTEATLKSALRATGSAGGFTTITAPGGNASLAAPSGPSLFQFSDIAFNDTITGFDARRDTIQLPKAVAADFATVKADTTSASGGSLITLNQNQSIFLAGLPPAKLAAGNFLLL